MAPLGFVNKSFIAQLKKKYNFIIELVDAEGIKAL
jgi:hypothetical protein